ncbi:hypothetical protein TW65_08538 [Stemphylium lycopersici]|uniref:Uncharacterized protein n=1 Tax=Stemphylium lycopersici TaxID=183478 RepID=A0A364NEQ3_STELY|nr:hypothetical protein TW65_08538 [Stemphylium lycopersici]RAR15804.1 hypothetical protein DDE83_000820 [Stemphylium lycopersici]
MVRITSVLAFLAMGASTMASPTPDQNLVARADIGDKASAGAAVADVVGKVYHLVQDMIDDDIKRRQFFTQKVVQDVHAEFPNYNIVVCNVGYKLGGSGDSLIHKTSYKAKIGSNVSFDVIIFKGPNTFRRWGDGGYENLPPGSAANIDYSIIHCDEDQGDEASVAATVLYEQEPFDTFQHTVREFAMKHFHRDSSEVTIEKMKGGSYNRVIGINITSKPKTTSFHWLKSYLGLGKTTEEPKRYILRIPRMGVEGDDVDDIQRKDMERDVTTMTVAESRLPLPVAKVESYNLTMDNVFGRPYMIQTRHPGRNLANDLWKDLNIEQKKCVAQKITNLAPIIASIEGPTGDVAFEALSLPPCEPVRVNAFRAPDKHANEPTSKPATELDPFDYLLKRCKQWYDFEKGDNSFLEDFWYKFAVITKSLEARGFLEGPCVYVHGDLKPHNILAEVRSETDVEITGIIDWDFAVIAPEFMAYRAPFWLWTPEDMNRAEVDKEATANIEPVNEEGRALKEVFLNHVSEKYKMFAFAPEAMLARRMFLILQEGMRSTWNYEEAESVIREWNELHPEDGIRVEESDSDVASDGEMEDAELVPDTESDREMDCSGSDDVVCYELQHVIM